MTPSRLETSKIYPGSSTDESVELENFADPILQNEGADYEYNDTVIPVLRLYLT